MALICDLVGLMGRFWLDLARGASKTPGRESSFGLQGRRYHTKSQISATWGRKSGRDALRGLAERRARRTGAVAPDVAGDGRAPSRRRRWGGGCSRAGRQAPALAAANVEAACLVCGGCAAAAWRGALVSAAGVLASPSAVRRPGRPCSWARPRCPCRWQAEGPRICRGPLLVRSVVLRGAYDALPRSGWSRDGAAPKSRRVYSSFGLSKICSAVPSSTARPPFMTTMRSEM